MTKKNIPSSLHIENNRLETKKPIKTFEEYVRVVRMLSNYWDTTEIWFRGQGDENYKLIPGAYRYLDKNSVIYDPEEERNIEDEYIRRAKSYFPEVGSNHDRWYWYQLMQHHGLPTRLLDWTEAGATALYFALRSINHVNSAVWIIDPHQFNKVTTDTDVVFYTDPSIKGHDDESVVGNYVPSRPAMPELPIAVSPAHSLPRISAQKGNFTVHGRGTKPIEEIFSSSTKPYLAKLIISEKKAVDIQMELEIMGLVETSLFPDLDGLARELRNEYSI